MVEGLPDPPKFRNDRTAVSQICDGYLGRGSDDGHFEFLVVSWIVFGSVPIQRELEPGAFEASAAGMVLEVVGGGYVRPEEIG